MSFHLAVRHRYPGVIRQREFVSVATSALLKAGFRPDNTLVAVSHCRDEITSSFRSAIEAQWGPVFELAGLAGLISAGPTGMAAALSHRPTMSDRSAFVVFAFSHVGFDEDGVVGKVSRPGIAEAVTTCGSLSGVKASGVAGPSSVPALDDSDLEQSNVIRRVGALIQPGADPDLADLADLALECIEHDIDLIFQNLARRSSLTPLGMDGALFTGVQVHGPQDQQLIWPKTAAIELDGQVSDALPASLRAAAEAERG